MGYDPCVAREACLEQTKFDSSVQRCSCRPAGLGRSLRSPDNYRGDSWGLPSNQPNNLSEALVVRLGPSSPQRPDSDASRPAIARGVMQAEGEKPASEPLPSLGLLLEDRTRLGAAESRARGLRKGLWAETGPGDEHAVDGAGGSEGGFRPWRWIWSRGRGRGQEAGRGGGRPG